MTPAMGMTQTKTSSELPRWIYHWQQLDPPARSMQPASSPPQLLTHVTVLTNSVTPDLRSCIAFHFSFTFAVPTYPLFAAGTQKQRRTACLLHLPHAASATL